MNQLTKHLLAFVLFAIMTLFGATGHAQPAVNTARDAHIGAHPATKALMATPIASQLQTLLGSSTPAPESSAPVSTPQSNTPVGTATAAPTTDTQDQDTEPQETFGTQALNLLITKAEQLGNFTPWTGNKLTAWADVNTWYNQQVISPRAADHWMQAGSDILWFVVLPFICALILDFLFTPLRLYLREKTPNRLSSKIATLLAIVTLKLIPILLFVGISLTLLDQNETQKFQRFVAFSLVYAATLGNLAIVLIRALFAPNAPGLRLIPASNTQSVKGCRWLIAFSLVVIYGYFFIDVARGIRVPASVIEAFTDLLGLGLVIMTLIVITQTRAMIATLLRGNLSAAQRDLSLYQSLRLWFARKWHVMAMAYLIIGYLIAASGIDKGLALLLRGTIGTLALFATMRVLFHFTDRWGSSHNIPGSASAHYAILRSLLRLVIWTFALIAVAATWGANISGFFATPLGQHLLGSVFSVGITIIIVAIIYEACSKLIERRLNRQDVNGKLIEASARSRTLLPLIRNVIFIIFAAIVGLVVLSEAGFNIAPLLAGAGIFGVAIGFGSQALVKDCLTGFFMIIENTIAVGDYVKIGDHSGTIEAMSLRTMRLRDFDGALHSVPYGEVSQVINMTKDYAFAVIKVGVAYNSDLNKVMDVMRQVGADMQKDPIYGAVISEAIEILGVDQLGDSAITIAARLRTRPGKQWDVRRQYLLRMKLRFDQEGIDIPFPTTVNLQRILPG